MQTNDLLPFSLDLALQGARLVTRDGREATFVAYIPHAAPNNQLEVDIVGIPGQTKLYPNGQYYLHSEHPHDLFVSPVQTKWVNVYTDSATHDIVVGHETFDSYEQGYEHGQTNSVLNCTFMRTVKLII